MQRSKRPWKLVITLLVTALCSPLFAADLVTTIDCGTGMTFTSLTGGNLDVIVDIGFRSWQGQACFPDSGFQANAVINVPPTGTSKSFTNLGLNVPAGCDLTIFATTTVIGIPGETHVDYCTTEIASNSVQVSQADLVVVNEIDLTHVPQPAGDTCISLAVAESEAALINVSFHNEYRGVLIGKYWCSDDAVLTDYCKDADGCSGAMTPQGDGLGGGFLGFHLTPSANCAQIASINISGSQNPLPICCDCSDLVIQCMSYVLTEIKPEGQSQFQQVIPPLWSSHQLDKDPEFATAGPSCDAFRFTEAWVGSLPGTCPTFLDADLDGESNPIPPNTNPPCDNLDPSRYPSAGGTRVTARNPDPSRTPVGVKFCAPLAGSHICDPPLPVTVLSPEWFEFVSPPRVPGPSQVLVEYTSESDEGYPFPNQNAIFREYLHVSNTGESAVRQLDAFEGERVTDTDPDDLQVSEIALAFAPWGADYSKDPNGNDRELFVTGIDTLNRGRLARFDPANPGDGVSTRILDGPARAVSFVDDEYGFVLYEENALQWSIEAVDIGGTILQLTPEIGLGNGNPVDIRVRDQGGGITYAYVVHHDFGCVNVGAGPMGMGVDPIPCPFFADDCPLPPGGGGNDQFRTLYLSVVDVTPPAFPGTTVATKVLANVQVSCLEMEHLEAGMDFNAAGDKLYVASPDEDRVWVVDTTTFAPEESILVGPHPTDVEVEFVDPLIGPPVERAFVSNRDDDTVTIFDLDDPEGTMQVLALDLDGIPNLLPTALAATSDGRTLYVVAPGSSVMVPINLRTNFVGLPITTGASPRRLTIQRQGN